MIGAEPVAVTERSTASPSQTVWVTGSTVIAGATRTVTVACTLVAVPQTLVITTS